MAGGLNLGSLYFALGVNTEQLIKARQEVENLARSVDQRFNQINASINSSLNNATQGQIKSTKAMETNFSQSLDKMGRNVYYFGTASMRFLTLPISLFGAATIKMTKDFEFSMQKIVGLVGISQTQVNSWSQSLLQLGPQLGRGPKELADSLYYVTSSGFKGGQALDIVTQSAKAASSGLGDTKDIVDLVTSAMSAYSNSNLSATKTLDILTAAVREGKGEATDFAKHLGDVIPVASQMGVSFDQVAGAVSSVTLTGQNVSKAVTGLRQVLFELQKPSVEAQKALTAMGSSFGTLRKSLVDKGLLATLKDINNLTQKFGVETMSAIFPNIRAYTNVLSLLGDRYNSNIALQQAVTNSTGAAYFAYNAVSDTIEKKYNVAVATAESSMIQFGLALKGPIISLLNTFSNMLKGLAEWFTKLAPGTQQLITDFAVFLAILGPLTIGIGLFSRALAGIMSTNIYIAGFVGLATAGMMLYSMFSGTSKAVQEYNDRVELLSGSTAKLMTSIENEKGSIITLFAALKSSNTSLGVRKAYMDEINTKYSEYLPNLLTEKSTLQDIADAENNVVKAMQAKLAAQFATTQSAAILTAQMERERKIFADPVFSPSKVPLTAWLAVLNEATDNLQQFGNIYAPAFEGSSKELEAVAKILKTTPASLANSFYQLANGSVESLQSLAAQRIKDTKAMENATNVANTYAAAIAKTANTPVKPTFTGGGSGIDISTLEKTKKIMADVAAGELFISLATRELGSEFDATGESLSLYKGALEKLLRLPGMEEGDSSIQILLKKLGSVDTEAAFTEKTIRQLNSKLDENTTLSKVLGETYNLADANLHNYNVTLEAFARKNITTGNAVNMLQIAIRNMQLESAKADMNKLTADLAKTAYENSLLAESFDINERKITNLQQNAAAYSKILQTLWTNQQKIQGKQNISITPDIRSAGDSLRLINQQIALLQNKDKWLSDMGNAFTKMGNNIKGASGKWLDWAGQVLSDLPAIIKMIQVLTSTQNAMTAAVEINTAANLANTASSIAQTSADSGSAIAAATKSGAKNPWPVNLIAIASGVAAVIAALSSIPKMANGGIVPGGFPGDTYPALLTSGETVVPPGKLEGLVGNGGGEVEFRISGFDLYGVLKKYSNKKSKV